jgi:hypothetical protein
MKLGGRANKLMDHNIAHVNKPSVILSFNDEAAKQHDVERIDTVTAHPKNASTNSLDVYDIGF